MRIGEHSAAAKKYPPFLLGTNAFMMCIYLGLRYLLVMLPVEHRCRMEATVSKHAHNSDAPPSAFKSPTGAVHVFLWWFHLFGRLGTRSAGCQKAIVAHESTSRRHRCKGHQNGALPQGAEIERCLGSRQNACLPRANGDLPFAFVVHFKMHRFRGVRVTSASPERA
ncbi:hypothetical protein MTO96_025211 [Rhipicephalus appendiculatus]